MFKGGTFTFREFVMAEQLPLATVQEAVLEFLRGREDVVVYGAQAVNAYVDEPRMTQGIDLISTRAEELADELRAYLHDRFHIAVRIRRVASGRGLRLFQVQKDGNRHLVLQLAIATNSGNEPVGSAAFERRTIYRSIFG